MKWVSSTLEITVRPSRIAPLTNYGGRGGGICWGTFTVIYKDFSTVVPLLKGTAYRGPGPL